MVMVFYWDNSLSSSIFIDVFSYWPETFPKVISAVLPVEYYFINALRVLRQFLATESPLKKMRNAFFHFKSFFHSQDI